jgi:integrase
MKTCCKVIENTETSAFCPELRTTNLIPQCDTVSVNARKPEKNQTRSVWTKAPVANMVRYEPSGIYFIRAKVHGKLIRKSLDTNVLSVAKQRLADVLDAEHRSTVPRGAMVAGKMTFGAALATFEERQKQDPELKPRSVEYNERVAACLLKSWPALAETDMKKLTKEECLEWRARFGQKYSPTVTNGALSLLRRVLDIAVEAGIRYDNPAKAKEVKRARVRKKELRLPEPDQFLALVKHVRGTGSGQGGHCSDAIEFFSYCGTRLTEASRVFGRDCDFKRGEIVIRGDPETGTKNWEIRRVPMIPEMRKLLERLKAERGEQDFLNNPVCHVRKFNRSLKNACKHLGLHHLTHHDLRHLFATRSIESGVPIPTVAKWLGHKDGGVLAMETYGHLRDTHSADMAQKVVFGNAAVAHIEATPAPALPSTPVNLVPLPATEQDRKAVAKTKAKYRFPWWASSDPLEMFWGQVNESVRLVPLERYHDCAKTAMGREVFAQEFADADALRDEFIERTSQRVLTELSHKILPPAEEKAAVVC